MQLMFVLTFMIMLATSMVSVSKRSSEDLASKADGVARQMEAWHRAAREMCLHAGCGGGLVAPYSFLPQDLRNGQAFQNGSYVTLYDSTNKLVLTFLSGNYQRAGLGYGPIAAALGETLDGPTNEIGTFNGSVIMPLRPLWRIHAPGEPAPPQSPIALNSPFAGHTIPVGTPVILSRI